MVRERHGFLGAFSREDDGRHDDGSLVERICAAYRYSLREFGDHRQTGMSQWTELNSRKAVMHEALMSGRGIGELLRTPARSNFLEGYENNFADGVSRLRDSLDYQELQANIVLDALRTMLGNLGLARLRNPEAPDREVKAISDVEDMIRLLNTKLGVSLTFPNPFPGEYGVANRAGLISIRAVYGLYQAYMTRVLLTHASSRSVIEIGAGLGRAAYFSYVLGLKDYTIVDLPMTNAAQAYFLGRVLGPANLTLAGESETGSLKILNPTCFQVDRMPGAGIVVCVDALTEMEYDTAHFYVDGATRIADVFYAVNHEVNEFTARQIIESICPSCLILHHEHNLRPGYVEDIVFNRSM